MAVFTNSFFSLSGQKERFTNVGAVVGAAFGKGTVNANVENKTLKAGLEYASNNPYTVAGLIAGGPAIARAGGSAFANAGVIKQGAIVLGTAASSALLATSEKARVSAFKVAGIFTVENAVKLGAGTGQVIENPSPEVAKNFAIENKSSLIGAGGLLVILGGSKLAGPVSNLIGAERTRENTEAVNNNTKAALNPPSSLPAPGTEKQPAAPPIAKALVPDSKKQEKPLDVAASPPSAPLDPAKQIVTPKTSEQNRKVYKRRASGRSCGKSSTKRISFTIQRCGC